MSQHRYKFSSNKGAPELSDTNYIFRIVAICNGSVQRRKVEAMMITESYINTTLFHEKEGIAPSRIGYNAARGAVIYQPSLPRSPVEIRDAGGARCLYTSERRHHVRLHPIQMRAEYERLRRQLKVLNKYSSADKAEADRYLDTLDRALYDVWQSHFANIFNQERDARIDKYEL